MQNCIVALIVIALAFCSNTEAKCVIQGVCGSERSHVCLPKNPKVFIADKIVNEICTKFPIGSSVCCMDEQLTIIHDALQRAKYWFGK